MLKPISSTGEELIFYNYKEPLKKVVGGFGYYGVILSNKEETGVQCHVCGVLYERLDGHVRMSHGISASDYKERYGLAYRTALISEKVRADLKQRTITWLSEMTPEQKERFKQRARNRFKDWQKKKIEKKKQPNLTLETKNKRGTCPDQLLEKIKVVAEKIGHSPSKNEFIDYWGSQKYIHIIYKTFGSWDKAKEMAGFNKLAGSSEKGKKKNRYSDEELMEYLQIFYKENGKVPTETDCRRGLIPESGVYRNRFGSFTQARIAAGITEQVGRWIKK